MNRELDLMDQVAMLEEEIAGRRDELTELEELLATLQEELDKLKR